MKKLLLIAALLTSPALTQADTHEDAFFNAAYASPLSYLYDDAFLKNKKIAKAASYPYKNTDPSIINAIKGTWIIQYNVGDAKYVSTMVIDAIFTTPDGDITGSGKFYTGQNAASGKLIPEISSSVICAYNPVVLRNLGGDFLCLSKPILYEGFSLDFSNGGVGGYHGIGLFNSSEVLDSIMDKSSTATGFLFIPTPTPSPTPSPTKLPIQTLSPIPAPVITPTLTPTPTPTPAPIPQATYDRTTGKLILPSVRVGAEEYSAELIYNGNGGADTFKLQSSTKK